jgi:hypothetical protein
MNAARPTILTIEVTEAHIAQARKVRAIGCGQLEPTGDLLRDIARRIALREWEAAQPRKSTREKLIERLGEAEARAKFPHHFA